MEKQSHFVVPFSFKDPKRSDENYGPTLQRIQKSLGEKKKKNCKSDYSMLFYDHPLGGIFPLYVKRLEAGSQPS